MLGIVSAEIKNKTKFKKMDIKKLKLAIVQAQKVCTEMNKCTNKFILQDSINEMNQALTIPVVVYQREQLKAFADFIQSDTSHMNYDFKDLVQEYLDSL